MTSPRDELVIEADPYRWPYDGCIEPDHLAHVIAGDQPAWIERSTRVAKVTATIEVLASVMREVGGAVVHLRHGAPTRSTLRERFATHEEPQLPPVVGSNGWRLATTAEPQDLVVDAAGIDGFYGSRLDAELRARGITHLLLTGFGAEAAVDSTLRSANDLGYECLVISDAVAAFDFDTGKHALSSVTMSGGIFGAVGTSDEVLSVLSRFSFQEAL